MMINRRCTTRFWSFRNEGFHQYKFFVSTVLCILFCPENLLPRNQRREKRRHSHQAVDGQIELRHTAPLTRY